MNLININQKRRKDLFHNVIGTKNKPSSQSQLKFKAFEGTFCARDLVSEPGNILHPDKYAKRLSFSVKMD